MSAQEVIDSVVFSPDVQADLDITKILRDLKKRKK